MRMRTAGGSANRLQTYDDFRPSEELS
jgi:hypothetical protein